MQRTFIIADIHGCLEPFLRLLAKIDADPDHDRLIFLGDYLNRGPASKEVINILIGLQEKMAQTIFLKGNHEVMLLDFLEGKNKELFKAAGGQATLKSYGAAGATPVALAAKMPESHRRFLTNLLDYWQDDHFIYVHAGLEPGRHLSQQRPQWLFWADRDHFIDNDAVHTKRIIFGHFAHQEPLIMTDKIGIDCGAVYGGFLTCLVLPDFEFIQVTSPQYWRPV